MTNKNLPPGWENRNSIAKPDWGNKKKEPFKQKIKSIENAIDSEKTDIFNSVTIIPDDEKINETIAETEISENVSVPEQAIKPSTKNESALSISNVEQTEKKTSESKASENIYVSEPIAEEYTEKGAAKKSNAVTIVLIILLIVLVIAIGVFATLYFTKDKAKDNIDTISGYNTSVTELAAAIDETTATTTTIVTSTITTSSTIEKVTTNKKINESDYIGFWNIENNKEHELTIHSIDSEKVVFSVWYYRLTSIEYVTANLEENKAYFNKDEVSGEVSGYLIFNDKSITLGITMSSIAYLPSNTEEIYDMHVNESIQHGNSSANAEIVNLNEPLYGEINCHQKNVSGYDSSYICNGNTISTVRDTLSDKWHITTSKLCYNYGTWWYECYDSDDGDYYGWVDSSFIDFYENDESNSVPYEDELVEPYIETETTIVDDIEFEYITYYADNDVVFDVKSIIITHTKDIAYYNEYEIKADAEINDKLVREIYLGCYMYDSDGYKIDEAALGKLNGSIKESYKINVRNENTAKIFIGLFSSV